MEILVYSKSLSISRLGSSTPLLFTLVHITSKHSFLNFTLSVLNSLIYPGAILNQLFRNSWWNGPQLGARKSGPRPGSDTTWSCDPGQVSEPCLSLCKWEDRSRWKLKKRREHIFVSALTVHNVRKYHSLLDTYLKKTWCLFH